MKEYSELHSDAAELLKKGSVGVIPTDTIYGIVGSALLPETTERIYALRYRKRDKPMIVLISDMNDLVRFGVELDEDTRNTLRVLWEERPTSIILPVEEGERWRHVHRGKGAIAFRIPRFKELIRLLRETGPLVAPSANIEGEPPAKDIEEAKAYFGDAVDFYVDGGRIEGSPSRLVSIEGGKLSTLRD